MAKVKMKPIDESELKNVETETCVEIRVCTRTRACSWKGTYPQMDTKRIDEVESVHVCPLCGNEEYYVEYMPIDKYKRDWVRS